MVIMHINKYKSNLVSTSHQQLPLGILQSISCSKNNITYVPPQKFCSPYGFQEIIYLKNNQGFFRKLQDINEPLITQGSIKHPIQISLQSCIECIPPDKRAGAEKNITLEAKFKKLRGRLTMRGGLNSHRGRGR